MTPDAAPPNAAGRGAPGPDAALPGPAADLTDRHQADGPPPDDPSRVHVRGTPQAATGAFAGARTGGRAAPAGPADATRAPGADVPVMARRPAPASGDALADLTAEVALLRAELDQLRQAFRRHCLETD